MKSLQLHLKTLGVRTLLDIKMVDIPISLLMERQWNICYCTAILPKSYGKWSLLFLGFSGWCLGGVLI